MLPDIVTEAIDIFAANGNSISLAILALTTENNAIGKRTIEITLSGFITFGDAYIFAISGAEKNKTVYINMAIPIEATITVE